MTTRWCAPGSRALLCGLIGIQVVGEAADGEEALALIRTHQPHVALLDIGMAKLNGLLAVVRVRQECPQTRVLILSMHANPAYVSRAGQRHVRLFAQRCRHCGVGGSRAGDRTG